MREEETDKPTIEMSTPYGYPVRYQKYSSLFIFQRDKLVFLDPDPHGSALILVSWIRIRIGNADLDSGGSMEINQN